MNHEGPSLESLLRRVAETPSDFLAEPRTTSGRGVVHVPAVVSDLLALHTCDSPDLPGFAPDDTSASRRQASLALLLCWLLADPELIARRFSPSALHSLLSEGASELSVQLAAAKYRDDPERREELVRFALARLDLRPSGESLAQAQDRLTALSSAERARVVAAARQAEQRARAIREALARKAAQESADKYTRE
jgi:hypothetical protein